MLQVEVAAKKERLNDLQGELRALETRHARFLYCSRDDVVNVDGPL